MESYVFISYAHKDSAEVLPVIEKMKANGIAVWYDEGIEAGTEWPATIERKLVECAAVIAFISPSAVESQNCRNEINLAISLKKEMLTVYLEETTLSTGMNLQLGTLQAIFKYRHPSDESFCNALLTSDFLAGFIKSGEAQAPVRPAPAPIVRSANPLDEIAKARRFSTVKFGSYPQSTMHPEPIEWIVVQKTCGEALLLSKHLLDCMDFGDSSWKYSDLREWLNEEFLFSAFSPQELESIHSYKRYTVSTQSEERVFLLDDGEIKGNFKFLRRFYLLTKPTQYAIRKGAFRRKGQTPWWIRSSRSIKYKKFNYNNPVVSGMKLTGIDYAREPQEHLDGFGVRPAIWVRYI